MQISIRTLAIVGVLVTGSLAYLSIRVDGLKEDVHNAVETAKENGRQIDQLKKDYTRIEGLLNEYKANKEFRDTSNTKMKSDAKRADVVAKKPKLVEKQINASFDKFSQDFQEATR